jgi:hypothetical protein
MKTPCLIGFALVVGLSSSACGTGTVASDNGDGGRKDGALASGYTYVAIIDVERQEKGTDFSCSDSNGPGSDIDAVALIRKGEIVGYGLVDSAVYNEIQVNQCKNDDCPDDDCKYTNLSKSLKSADLIASTAGAPNAEISKDGDDKGYQSLNGGTLQIRIGNKDGKEPGQDIRSGDQIKVFEVDQTKKTDSNGCACAPEKYQVVLQRGQDNLTLRPSQFDKANSSVCGASPSSDSQLGCGTTVFDVP